MCSHPKTCASYLLGHFYYFSTMWLIILVLAIITRIALGANRYSRFYEKNHGNILENSSSLRFSNRHFTCSLPHHVSRHASIWWFFKAVQ
uniref:Putative secreted protein n=1 Tax=Xenopsylla cheopis TaxID=163159 RepID=A0A6M2E2I1_XENCH